MIPFSFQKEHKIGKCEDAEPVAEPHYSIVCDGLGGAGLTVHTDPKGNKHTSAYLGSRIVRDCVLDFFSKAGDSSIGDSSIKDYVSLNLEKLRDNIKSKLKEEMEKLEPKPNRSKTIKIFPTTLASAVYSYSETKNKILAVWAGDSRVYMLNRQGLHLLSKDDLDEAEQMNCDGAMNNCISAGEEFHLNYSLYSIDGPCIVFCCSDGCFREELFKSPLHFEVSLLETIANLPEVENEKLGTVLADNLKSIYKSIIDDTTMSGVIMGINSVRDMADFAKARLKDINTPALNIHKIITEKKELQRKKDEAKKALVLSEKRLTVVRNEIDQLLETEGEKKNPAMYEFVKKISSYRQYEAQKKTDVREREQYYHKLKEEAKKEEAECLDYFLCDYVIHKKNSLW